ncbi:MAG TPA: HNH endonuclease [Planctomycetota bacterium]|nr:HNH endonuclease [Planctomycetota bacterium]
MRGFIANTDYDWYSFLSAHPSLTEVNFWQPRGGQAFRAIQPGEPFFFKLKKPYFAITGFGYFARHSVLPAWLAWDSFETANGAPDFTTMRERIERLRRASVPDSVGNYTIGCIMVADPVFFPEQRWVRVPSDFEPNIQRGVTYDLTVGEGKRVWDECRLQAGQEPAVTGAVASPRYGEPTLIRPRMGQRIFRIAVTDAYGRACAVSQEHSLPALEAGHIRPYAEGGEHQVPNGLLFRSDIHRLFDKGYVTVTPDYRFHVSERLREDYRNGRSYFPFDNSTIRLPSAQTDRPDRDALAWHQSTVFLA